MSGTIQDILNFLRGAPAEQAEPAAAETAPLTTESPRAPVVTNAGAATARPPADNSPFTIPPESQSALDRLASFGAAMASTRSPTFQGAFGEGVQALLRQGAAQRQEARQQQQADTEQEYRRALVANQEAELRLRENPNSPQNQLLVAQTRLALAQAQRALREPVGGGLGQGMPIELGEGRQGLLMRDGSVRELPRNARFLRSAEQEDRSEGRRATLYIQARSRAAAELGANPSFIGLPETQQEAAIERRTQTILRSLPGYAQQPAAPTEGAASSTDGNRVRLPGL